MINSWEDWSHHSIQLTFKSAAGDPTPFLQKLNRQLGVKNLGDAVSENLSSGCSILRGDGMTPQQ